MFIKCLSAYSKHFIAYSVFLCLKEGTLDTHSLDMPLCLFGLGCRSTTCHQQRMHKHLCNSTGEFERQGDNLPILDMSPVWSMKLNEPYHNLIAASYELVFFFSVEFVSLHGRVSSRSIFWHFPSAKTGYPSKPHVTAVSLQSDSGHNSWTITSPTCNFDHHSYFFKINFDHHSYFF